MRLKKVPCQLYMINYWTTAIYSSQDYVASQSEDRISIHVSVTGPSVHGGAGEGIALHISASKQSPSKGL